MRALHLAVRPAKLYHHLVAVLIIREVDDRLLEVFLCFPCSKYRPSFTVCQVYSYPNLGVLPPIFEPGVAKSQTTLSLKRS